MLPLVALIGRTNVGKSTLFNRLLRSDKAITHNKPGVTRDRLYGEVHHAPKSFSLVDTGGLYLDSGTQMKEAIFEQAREAIQEAQLLLLVMDGRSGLTETDRELAEFLRKSRKPVFAVVNKVDGAELEQRLAPDFYELGLDLFCVSAAHGFAVPELVESICSSLPQELEEEPESCNLRMALLGRPNVGKSSMVNAFVGEKRLIVDSRAGTTRDSVDVALERGGKRYLFIDTAGVRRRSRVNKPLEQFSVLRALKTSSRADVSVLLLDAVQGVTQQDKKILDYLQKEKIPALAAVNKIDLIPKPKLGKVKAYFEQELRICPHMPLVFTSSVNKSGLGGVLPLAEKIWGQYNKRISTAELNRGLEEMVGKHQPPVVAGRRAKFYYMTQPEVSPPTFVFFLNDRSLVGKQYSRYLEKQLRKIFALSMTPVRMVFRTSRG